MQELRDDLIQIFNDNNIPIILQIDKYLEKEKEQIIKAMSYSTYREMKGINVSNEEYYNQNYNQEPKKEYQPSEKYLKKQKELMEDFIWDKMNKNNQNK